VELSVQVAITNDPLLLVLNIIFIILKGRLQGQGVT
jgi:hypothetical protein